MPPNETQQARKGGKKKERKRYVAWLDSFSWESPIQQFQGKSGFLAVIRAEL